MTETELIHEGWDYWCWRDSTIDMIRTAFEMMQADIDAGRYVPVSCRGRK